MYWIPEIIVSRRGRVEVEQRRLEKRRVEVEVEQSREEKSRVEQTSIEQSRVR